MHEASLPAAVTKARGLCPAVLMGVACPGSLPSFQEHTSIPDNAASHQLCIGQNQCLVQLWGSEVSVPGPLQSFLSVGYKTDAAHSNLT